MTSNTEKDSEIERLKTLLENRDAEIEEQNSKIRSHETERRKLHNQIQELKVRTFITVYITEIFSYLKCYVFNLHLKLL